MAGEASGLLLREVGPPRSSQHDARAVPGTDMGGKNFLFCFMLDDFVWNKPSEMMSLYRYSEWLNDVIWGDFSCF